MQSPTVLTALAMAIATTLFLTISPPSQAARGKSCLRVVPSGEIIMWYGSRCP